MPDETPEQELARLRQVAVSHKETIRQLRWKLQECNAEREYAVRGLERLRLESLDVVARLTASRSSLHQTLCLVQANLDRGLSCVERLLQYTAVSCPDFDFQDAKNWRDEMKK